MNGRVNVMKDEGTDASGGMYVGRDAGKIDADAGTQVG